MEKVAEAIETLLGRRVHPNFPGYLCLKREAVRSGRTSGLTPSFLSFHDLFLRVEGGPQPYCRPFWDESDASRGRMWYQGNVAGSYAPSSWRRIPALMSVATITDGRYALKEGHWELARRNLLFGSSLPVLSLVTFLYRDFSLTLAEPLRLSDAVAVFREEFGYDGAGEQECAHLFTETGIDTSASKHLMEL